MRISDWSSDVCSSDLVLGLASGEAEHTCLTVEEILHQREVRVEHVEPRIADDGCRRRRGRCRARKSVVSGKSVSVRVDLGGRRIIKKKRSSKISLHLSKKAKLLRIYISNKVIS